MLERLEDAFARQRDFVSDASHELRTPLSVLRAQVEVLDRETDEPHRIEATVTLLRRLDEMDRLVADMLTLAGAESGRLVDPRPIDLDDYFEDLRRDLPLFGDRDFRVEAVGGVLVADPDRLTQVLRNLVRNAVAHTRPERPHHRRARARGGRLEIAVADTGPASRPSTSRRSSSASTAPTTAARATAAAAAWGWRSRGRSSRPTAAGSRPSPRPAAAPRSGSSCRATARPTRGKRALTWLSCPADRGAASSST